MSGRFCAKSLFSLLDINSIISMAINGILEDIRLINGRVIVEFNTQNRYHICCINLFDYTVAQGIVHLIQYVKWKI